MHESTKTKPSYQELEKMVEELTAVNNHYANCISSVIDNVGYIKNATVLNQCKNAAVSMANRIAVCLLKVEAVIPDKIKAA